MGDQMNATGTIILKKTSEKSFFVNFTRHSKLWNSLLEYHPERPLFNGERARILQIAYCDGWFVAECVLEKDCDGE